MLSEKGFSLIEVLISLSILSVSVIAISYFFTQANEVSAGNNNKLVATNLARMTLARVQHDYTSFGITKAEKTYTKLNCSTTGCASLYTATINNNNYDIEIKVLPQSTEEAEIKLFPVTIKVNYKTKQGVKGTIVEGYVTDAK
ncbi:type IV pilus modification PilV family protein [Fictibacillus barbaricus]|uniref:Prepilin-type N-terminal cleavage/methylation domain-containing protein n=1 Tax=Fictibacillus barbaricus TaxID=182136 RepID=A0ABU1U109_9BACL|nr:prepilin-type N-terminal cleavage/methylation domain-containing protein [Fictibacillus barbaricus]MDR7073145.1 prepilin-type N-terminal cleavage/methylation domain-containing protein [Fictibacillus barbaricus]